MQDEKVLKNYFLHEIFINNNKSTTNVSLNEFLKEEFLIMKKHIQVTDNFVENSEIVKTDSNNSISVLQLTVKKTSISKKKSLLD